MQGIYSIVLNLNAIVSILWNLMLHTINQIDKEERHTGLHMLSFKSPTLMFLQVL